jgi:hypothetical protein
MPSGNQVEIGIDSILLKKKLLIHTGREINNQLPVVFFHWSNGGVGWVGWAVDESVRGSSASDFG